MVVWVHSGLTSRCITLAHAYYLEKKYNGKDAKLVIVWPKDNGCNIGYYEVFDRMQFNDIKVKVVELDLCNRSISEVIKGKKVFAILQQIWRRVCQKVEVRKIKKQLKRDYEWIEYTPPKEIGWSGQEYDAYQSKRWQQVQECLGKGKNICVHAYCGIIKDKEEENIDLRKIQFLKKYINKCDDILEKGKRYIGIHIRRTDHSTAIENSSTSVFIQKISEYLEEDSNVHFFLATDDEKEEMELKRIFGKIIVTQTEKSWGRDSENGMVSGIIDSLCLARCEVILGSYTSVFSKFSAEYGDIPLILCKNE